MCAAHDVTICMHPSEDSIYEGMECVESTRCGDKLQLGKPAVRAQISVLGALGCDHREALAAGDGAVSFSAPATQKERRMPTGICNPDEQAVCFLDTGRCSQSQAGHTWWLATK